MHNTEKNDYSKMKSALVYREVYREILGIGCLTLKQVSWYKRAVESFTLALSMKPLLNQRALNVPGVVPRPFISYLQIAI